MAYTARLTKQQLDKEGDTTRDRSRYNTKGTVQYLVTYAYTNNNCLLCASNIIVSVAIPTLSSGGRQRKTWMDNVREDLKEKNIDLTRICEATRNREVWRNLVRASSQHADGRGKRRKDMFCQ